MALVLRCVDDDLVSHGLINPVPLAVGEVADAPDDGEPLVKSTCR